MTADEKIQAAKEWLGTRWVLHPDRRVQRGNYEPHVMRCDVAKTFAKEFQRLNRTQIEVAK